MSNFESTALSTDNTSSGLAGAAAPAASSAATTTSGGISSPAPSGADGDGTPLTAEETADVFSEQPTGDVPTAEEMEDRKDATSSADNLLPTDKLQNGLKNVRARPPLLLSLSSPPAPTLRSFRRSGVVSWRHLSLVSMPCTDWGSVFVTPKASKLVLHHDIRSMPER